jgi:hypothetical protein
VAQSLRDWAGAACVGERRVLMPDVHRQDAAVAAATTVWNDLRPVVLPLTVALPAIHGARLRSDASRYPRFDWRDVPVAERM